LQLVQTRLQSINSALRTTQRVPYAATTLLSTRELALRKAGFFQFFRKLKGPCLPGTIDEVDHVVIVIAVQEGRNAFVVRVHRFLSYGFH
jgi:hypothetical protein